jgi:hypothetical protein
MSADYKLREIWYCLGLITLVLILLMVAILGSGCAANCPKQHGHWKNVGDPGIPIYAACGQRITFEFADGHKETWIYPCWPQKNVPKCVEGCPVRPVEKGRE